jgi:hypothetical protein
VPFGNSPTCKPFPLGGVQPECNWPRQGRQATLACRDSLQLARQWHRQKSPLAAVWQEAGEAYALIRTEYTVAEVGVVVVTVTVFPLLNAAQSMSLQKRLKLFGAPDGPGQNISASSMLATGSCTMVQPVSLLFDQVPPRND